MTGLARAVVVSSSLLLMACSLLNAPDDVVGANTTSTGTGTGGAGPGGGGPGGSGGGEGVGGGEPGPPTGLSAAGTVSAGGVAKSASYRMVFTTAEPQLRAGVSKSTSFRLHEGIGAAVER